MKNFIYLCSCIALIGFMTGCAQKTVSVTSEKTIKEAVAVTGPARFSFPQDYKNWTHGTSKIILDKESPLYGFQQVFVNNVALDAYKRGSGYPDGSMLVLGFYEAIEEGDEIKQGNILWYAVMKKDSRAEKTSGWIFDGFDGKTYQSTIDDPVTGCYNCHIAKKDREYVFTSFAGDISVPKDTQLPAKPGSFAFTADVRSWRHSNSKVILDKKSPLYGFQQIYVNDTGFKANKSGEIYPDGSHITVGFYEPVVDGKTISQGDVIWYASMKKDSKAAPGTGGWIMDGFDGKKLHSVVDDPVSDCFNCHLSQKSHDYVFSKYIP